MGCIFKPQPLTWDDIDGGLGETIYDRIFNFICYEPDFTDDVLNEYQTEYYDFVEYFDKFRSRYDSNEQKICAALSLTANGALTSCAKDDIKKALLKSAKKEELLDLLGEVTSLYVWYNELSVKIFQRK